MPNLAQCDIKLRHFILNVYGVKEQHLATLPAPGTRGFRDSKTHVLKRSI